MTFKNNPHHEKTTFTFLLALVCQYLTAQCPTVNITFSTQAAIDSFPINYPGCTELDSSVLIRRSDIVRLDSLYSFKKIRGQFRIDSTMLTDLSGLNGLDSVYGSLGISDNPVLATLSGLGNLKYVGVSSMGSGIDNIRSSGLEISGNPLLTSLGGLEELKTVAGCVDITGNPSLISLAGLSHLNFVGNCFSFPPSDYRGLTISANTSLKSLAGLDNLQYIEGSLGVFDNDSLTTLSGLEYLDSIGRCLNVASNPALISLDGLSGLQSIGYCNIWHFGNRSLFLRDNASLSSINGLSETSFYTASAVVIEQCPYVVVCNIQSICQHLENGGFAFISDNAPGCNSVAEVEAACMVSIEETSEGEPVILFSPNPAGDFLQIQINDSQNWDIYLCDLQGRLIFRQAVSGSEIIDVKAWPSGIYVLRAVNGRRFFAGKVVKQR